MRFGIEVRQLCKTYRLGRVGGRAADIMQALNDVSFSIGEGERVGIIGVNGAGKSTLLQILAGVSTPTSGVVEVQGTVHAALTLGVGFKDQLSGRENLKLECQIQGVPSEEIPSRVEQMIAFADLGEFIDRPVRTYSSGMQSRLSFANLVFADPEILLVDETLTAGDQFFQRRAADAMKQLCSRGSIVVMVSHRMDAIVSMCSRCIWLHKGQIVADGPPEHVTAAYSNAQSERAEQEMVRELGGLTRSLSGDARTRLHAFGVVGGAGRAFEPSDPVAFAAEIEILERLDDVRARLCIERLDGVVVGESEMALGRCFPGRYRPRADIERLSIGPAYYIARFELRDGAHLLVSRSEAFQVRMSAPFLGGTPMLAPVIHAYAERRL